MDNYIPRKAALYNGILYIRRRDTFDKDNIYPLFLASSLLVSRFFFNTSLNMLRIRECSCGDRTNLRYFYITSLIFRSRIWFFIVS